MCIRDSAVCVAQPLRDAVRLILQVDEVDRALRGSAQTEDSGGSEVELATPVDGRIVRVSETPADSVRFEALHDLEVPVDSQHHVREVAEDPEAAAAVRLDRGRAAARLLPRRAGLAVLVATDAVQRHLRPVKGAARDRRAFGVVRLLLEANLLG